MIGVSKTPTKNGTSTGHYPNQMTTEQLLDSLFHRHFLTEDNKFHTEVNACM